MGSYYQPLPLEPLPMPEKSEVEVTPARPEAYQLPPGAGYVGYGPAPKAAVGAKYASDILSGWLKGVQAAKQQGMEKAQRDYEWAQRSSAKAEQEYTDFIKKVGPQDKWDDAAKQRAAELQENARKTHELYVQTVQKYLMPEPQKGGKQPGFFGRVGKAAKQTFLGGPLQMIPFAALEAAKAHDPVKAAEQAAMLTPEEQERRKMVTAQTRAAEAGATAAERGQARQERVDKAVERLSELGRAPAEQRDAAWTQQYNQARQEYNLARGEVPSPEQETRDSVWSALSGTTQWTPELRQAAQAIGVLPRETVQIVADPSSRQQVAVMFDPVSKTSQKIPLGIGLPPDQVEQGNRALKMRLDTYYAWAKQAFPTAPDAQVRQVAFAAAADIKLPTTGAAMNVDERQRILHRGVQAVMSGLSPEDKERFSNFAVADPTTSEWVLLPTVGAPQPQGVWSRITGGQPQYRGGISAEQLPMAEAQFRMRLKDTLIRQNPRLTPDQVRELVGEPVAQPLQAPPGQPAAPQRVGAPPAAAPAGPVPTGRVEAGVPQVGRYKVTIGGVTQERSMTPQQAEELRKRGVTVVESTATPPR